MPPQFLKRSLADVEVANVVGKTFAGAVGVQGLAFAKTLRKAMSQKYLKGALPYNKDLNLLAHAVEKVASGGTPLEAVERVCRKRWRRDRLWFDVTGGCKAQVIQAALKGLHSAKDMRSERHEPGRWQQPRRVKHFDLTLAGDHVDSDSSDSDGPVNLPIALAD
eukprot:g23061.t1